MPFSHALVSIARLLVVVGLLGSSLTVQALDSQDVFEKNEQAVFQIRVIHRETGKKSTIGSGFLFARPTMLATNYHVVSSYIEKPEIYELRFLATDGSEGPLELIGVDAVHDLALVEAEAPLGAPLSLDLPPAKGAPLFAMGNPLDLGLTIAAGTNGGVLSQTDGSRILFSGNLNPGMSGGPTFDAEGHVVGINVATARNDISFIVPSNYLEQLGRSADASRPFQDQVGQQIRDYQIRYLNGISETPWPSTQLREVQVPAAISPTVRCWDTSPKPKPEHLYRRFSTNCKNENDIFLSKKLEVGKLLYEFIWLETEVLGPLRFHRLYQALNRSQFDGRAGEEEVGRFECRTRFVDVNSLTFKATLCARPYKTYAGLSDVLFTAAMVGKPNRGLIFNLDLSGTDTDTALKLIARFLGEIAWRN